MIVSSGEQSQDIRYSFINTLDHFACEYVRTLWTIQHLDSRRDAAQLQGKAAYLRNLVQERTRSLRQYRQDLEVQKEINKRYALLLRRKKGAAPPPAAAAAPPRKDKRLLLKINLKARKSAGSDSKSEPRYCYCNDVSYGPMIACDNANCEREWFHYGCVGITKPPAGKWYCKTCKNKIK